MQSYVMLLLTLVQLRANNNPSYVSSDFVLLMLFCYICVVAFYF